jgi:hypothetical protein
MSNITLSANAGGTGIFTIASPSSNTNRTLTLPDVTGTFNVSGAATEVPAGSASTPSIYPTGDTNTGIFFPAADTIAFTEGGAEVARIDSSGRWTVSSQPGFMAGIAATTDATISANSVVPFNTVTGTGAFNTGTNFNTSTSLFTAPIAGRYQFSFTVFLTNSASSTQSMQAGVRVNGSFVSFTSGDAYGVASATPNSAGGSISVTVSVILSLAANDTVGVAARTNAIRIYQGHCFFSGFLLG